MKLIISVLMPTFSLKVLIETGNPAHDQAQSPEKKDVDFFHEIITTSTPVISSEAIPTNGANKRTNGSSPLPEEDVTGIVINTTITFVLYCTVLYICYVCVCVILSNLVF